MNANVDPVRAGKLLEELAGMVPLVEQANGLALSLGRQMDAKVRELAAARGVPFIRTEQIRSELARREGKQG